MVRTTTVVAIIAGDLLVRALRASKSTMDRSASEAWSTIGQIEYRITDKIFRGWG